MFGILPINKILSIGLISATILLFKPGSKPTPVLHSLPLSLGTVSEVEELPREPFRT